ncbi:hypothetical protein D3C81_2039100 [compost metagenome]
MDVAGIETNGQPFVMNDFVDNGGNLLEAAANLCSFAGHCLQSNVHFRLVRTAKHLV